MDPIEHPWWIVCAGCGRHTVDPAEPPRYDVLAADQGADSGAPGPFGPECWQATTTGALEHDRMTADEEEPNG